MMTHRTYRQVHLNLKHLEKFSILAIILCRLKINVLLKIYLDAQDGMPTSFENEVVIWLPENGHNSNIPACVGADTPSIPIR